MSWEAGPGALTLPGKRTRLTATAEASGGGVCTGSQPSEGSGAGKDLETPRWGLAWLGLHRAGAGGCCVPRCWPPGFLSHAGIQGPQAKEISGWVGGWARKATGPAGGAARVRKPCGFPISRGAVHPQGTPGLSIKPPHFSPASHPGRSTTVPVALDNTATGPGGCRTQEEPTRHHGQAGLGVSSVLEF